MLCVFRSHYSIQPPTWQGKKQTSREKRFQLEFIGRNRTTAMRTQSAVGEALYHGCSVAGSRCSNLGLSNSWDCTRLVRNLHHVGRGRQICMQITRRPVSRPIIGHKPSVNGRRNASPTDKVLYHGCSVAGPRCPNLGLSGCLYAAKGPLRHAYGVPPLPA